ncbi:hypothetical protein GCM10027046_05510 [Uliginosibacterium flavum]|uniref:Uncharacterized protein n=1 Tax=Uliginosibacterium flavum TaxID=1396831 RepID=A0ABV2TIY8_9RHOO
MPDISNSPNAPRLILCHKQMSSARLRFLSFTHGLLAFDPLPSASRISIGLPHTRIQAHPAAWARYTTDRLGMDASDLRVETDFHAEASLRFGGVHIPILLACFTSIDPPFEMAKQHGARFIAITEAQGATTQELALLRLAYEHLIG